MVSSDGIEAIVAYAGQLSEAAQRSNAASVKQHGYIHGDEFADVATESGPVPSIAKQARLSSERTAVLEGKLADPAFGGKWVAFQREKPRAPIENIAHMLSTLPISVWEFAKYVTFKLDPENPATWDWAPAINTAMVSMSLFPLAGTGGVLDLGDGDFGVGSTINQLFGVSLIGRGSDRYTTQLIVLDGFVGDAVVKMTDTRTNYFNGHFRGISIDLRNKSGLNGVVLLSGQRNSGVSDLVAYNLHADAIGFLHEAATHEGAGTLGESVFIRDIYCIKARLVANTAPSIRIRNLQEATLINVKGFNGSNPGTPLGEACLDLIDCRGVTVIGGGGVGGKYGCRVSATGRESVGIHLINFTSENNSDEEVHVEGTAAFPVRDVHVQIRREYPYAARFLGTKYANHVRADIGEGNADIGVGCFATELTGNGAGTITGAGKYTFIGYGNAVSNRIDMSPLLRVSSDNSPSIQLAVPGQTGAFVWRWAASATTNFGAQILTPSGFTAFDVGESGGAVRMGFFGTAGRTRPVVTGAKSGNAVITSICTALAQLGLITDSTT